MRILTTVGFSLAVALAACGGGQKSKSNGAGGDSTKSNGGMSSPPSDLTAVPGKTTPEEPKREISKDAKSDYNQAAQFFAATEKTGWSEATCRQSAEKFAAVAREHTDLVEASYMVGLSYHRCGLMGDAEKAYRGALERKSNHAQSLSNLGDIYWKAGKVAEAKKAWDSALAITGKLPGARVNLASLQLEELRKMPAGPGWNKLADEISLNLSNALAVDSDDVETYTVFGLFYLEGYEKNKNRLDLANLLLGEGEKRSTKFAPLKNARGLYFMRRNDLTKALEQFTAAVELDPKFLEARMNVGLITLGFRNYAISKEQFTKVLEAKPKNFDALIGLGIALRGLGELDAAEASYKKAKDLNSQKGDSFYNLGVLYQSFKANKRGADLRGAQGDYRVAKDFFKEFLTREGTEADKAEAKANIGVCDKNIAQLDNFLKSQAAAAPTAPTPAAPAPKTP
jgi:tetratricopeptide (TPR) repeat protein